MPFALLIIGLVLLTTAVRGTQDDLFTLVKKDFTGQNNFIYWVVSILIIGSLGYVPKLKSFSVAFLGLVIIVLVLTKGNPNGIGGGFFNQFTAQLKSTTVPTTGSTGATGTPSTSSLPDLTGAIGDLSTMIPGISGMIQ